jgi:hypothetical protein
MAADRLFRTISLAQICIHLCAYLAAFVKLILIEAGGYYDTGVISFLGITLVFIPVFTIEWRLIQRSLTLSKSSRVWGYCLNVAVGIWSIWIVKSTYF